MVTMSSSKRELMFWAKFSCGRIYGNVTVNKSTRNFLCGRKYSYVDVNAVATGLIRAHVKADICCNNLKAS